MSRQRASLILFSGIDGGGKSTQIERLLSVLRSRGANPVCFWSRGGYTPGFEWLKRLVRRGSGGALPGQGKSQARKQAFSKRWVRSVWLSLALLDLMFWYGVRIRFWRWSGRPVVLDRYWPDTAIDFQLNFPGSKVESGWMWRCLLMVAPKPERAFLLRVPVEESQRRSKLKNEPFPDDEETLRDRLKGYDEWSGKCLYKVLDGRRSIDSLATEILASVDELES